MRATAAADPSIAAHAPRTSASSRGARPVHRVSGRRLVPQLLGRRGPHGRGHFAADPRLGAAVTGRSNCPAAPASAALTRKSSPAAASACAHAALAEVGGLPEDFFMQAEEYDLSLRLLDAGWRVQALRAPPRPPSQDARPRDSPAASCAWTCATTSRWSADTSRDEWVYPVCAPTGRGAIASSPRCTWAPPCLLRGPCRRRWRRLATG
jgi:hypothetical protein